MTSLLSDLGLIVEWVVLRASDVLTMITQKPVLLLICVGLLIVGFVVGWVSRLFRVN